MFHPSSHPQAGPDAHRGGFPPSGTSAEGKVTWKAVFTVTERAKGKRMWLRIGIAFVNRDGSMTIRLDALPQNGQLIVRDPFPSGSREMEAEGPGSPLYFEPSDRS
jgi:hypothetical protein